MQKRLQYFPKFLIDKLPFLVILSFEKIQGEFHENV